MNIRYLFLPLLLGMSARDSVKCFCRQVTRLSDVFFAQRQGYPFSSLR